MKPIFNINNYKGMNVVMHCPTVDDYNIFAEYLDSVGERWCSKDRYIDYTPVLAANEQYDLCINFIAGTYDSVSYFERQNCTVLEFRDFSWANDIEFEDTDEMKNFLCEL